MKQDQKPGAVVLSMKGIDISFPGVRALKGVDFALREGEVHALMGENGAGKSTLVKCLTGVYKKDAGIITYEGRQIDLHSPQEAMSAGISTVYQEVNLCPNLTVAENIFIGRQPIKGGLIDWKTMNSRSKEALKRFDLEQLDVTMPLSTFSVAIQQMIAIARAVDISAKVLILDEPTSSLDINEVKGLFDVINGLKAQGMAIVFITHFLDQVYQISDRITVLRNGELVGEYPIGELTKIDLVTKMVGKDFDDITSLSRIVAKEGQRVLIEAEHIGTKGDVDNIDLQLHTSEITGFAGLLGSGRTEVAEMLFGVRRQDCGTMRVNGRSVSFKSPDDAIQKRIAFCPEDRKKDGIIADLTIRENIVLAIQARQGVFKYIPKSKQAQIADRYIKLLGIATPDCEKKIGELSGGNQQKVILARWLATEPELLILDEPTRGIDVGAKAEIMKLTLELCEQGMSVVFISSEMEEVVRMSNKVIVMRDRKKVAQLDEEEISQERILTAIAGGVQ